MRQDFSGKVAQITNQSHLLFGATGQLLRCFNTTRGMPAGVTYRFICTGDEGMSSARRGKETIVHESDIAVL